MAAVDLEHTNLYELHDRSGSVMVLDRAAAASLERETHPDYEISHAVGVVAVGEVAKDSVLDQGRPSEVLRHDD